MPVFAARPPRPLFVTVTHTVGQDRGHLDVSLWFVLSGERGMTLAPDPSEIREARWWSPAEVLAGDPRRLDPHYGRFAASRSSVGCGDVASHYQVAGWCPLLRRWGDAEPGQLGEPMVAQLVGQDVEGPEVGR